MINYALYGVFNIFQCSHYDVTSIYSLYEVTMVWATSSCVRSFRWMSLGESPARGLAKALSRQGWGPWYEWDVWVVDSGWWFLVVGVMSHHFSSWFCTLSLDFYGCCIGPTALRLMGLEWWLSSTFQATKSFGTCLHFRLCVDTSPERAVRGQPTQTVSWHVLAEYGWVLPEILKATRWGQGWWLSILNTIFLHA